MLIDVTFSETTKKRLAMVLEHYPGDAGMEAYARSEPLRLAQGVYQTNSWNPGLRTDQKIEPIVSYTMGPDGVLVVEGFAEALHRKIPVAVNDEWDRVELLPPYGVCDGPEQLLSLYDFEADPRQLVIFLVEMRKEDQPERDGWRWHKWGPYVGTQNPQCEYLYDEPEIESAWTYSIYRVLGDKPC